MGCALRMDRAGFIDEARCDEALPLSPVTGDGRQPFAAVRGNVGNVLATVEFAQNLPQEGADIGHQAERDRIVAADLVGIDVDMDELGRRDVEGIAGYPRTGGAVVETHAERENDVGLAGGVVGLVLSVAGDQAETEFMVAVDGALTAGRIGDRNPELFGKREQIGRGTAILHALPDQNDRLGRRQQHVHGLDDTFRVGAAFGGDVRGPRLGIRRLFCGSFLEDVERDIQHDRARSARHHGFPCLPNGKRHHFTARRLVDALAVSLHGGGEISLMVPIEFLEGAAIELAGGNIAGDRQEGHRVRDRRCPARSACSPSRGRRM